MDKKINCNSLLWFSKFSFNMHTYTLRIVLTEINETSDKQYCVSNQAMIEDFYIESYGLPPQDQNFNEELEYEMERRKLEREMSKGDYFEPWFPVQEQ